MPYYERTTPRAPRMTYKVRCRFCRNKSQDMDYKDTQLLQKFCTLQGKIMSRKRSGNCIKHQRQVQQALKLARYMALLPYLT